MFKTLFFWGLDGPAAAILLLPVFCLLNKHCFHNKRKTVWYFFLALYLCAVYVVVGLPDIRYVRLDFNINLKPFAYMFSAYKSSLLNVALFVPLGFFLTVLWKRFGKVWWTVLFGFFTSLTIELLQIFTYRATDVNDLITNTLGTLVGWLFGCLALRLIPELKPEDDIQTVFAICAISFGVMFFLHPFLADAFEPLLYPLL